MLHLDLSYVYSATLLVYISKIFICYMINFCIYWLGIGNNH
jgi:hypothetical protein